MYSIVDIETTGGQASGNRITEIAIKAQQAADTARVVSLRDSLYRTP